MKYYFNKSCEYRRQKLDEKQHTFKENYPSEIWEVTYLNLKLQMMKQTNTSMAEHTRSNLKTNATNKSMKETTQQQARCKKHKHLRTKTNTQQTI